MSVRRFFLLSAFSALVYVAFVFVSPRVTAYSAKTALRSACVAAMRGAIAAGADPSWEQDFLGRMRDLGIELEDSQYLFQLSDSCQKGACSCEGQLAFELFTPWPMAETLGASWPPYRSVHRIQVDVAHR